MIPALRQQFNANFTAEKYAHLLKSLEKRCGTPVQFRVSETPCFFPKALLEKMAAYGSELIHQLVLHPGEVVSRERLLSDVWGYHFDPGSNVVDVCVRRLRKKLGPDAPIETVRHAGYRLAA